MNNRKATPDIMAAVLNPSAAVQLTIDQIRADGGTQMRAQLDMETVAEYRDAMLEAGGWGSFPSVVVFYDGENYWLADGFHRITAIKSAQPMADVPADIRSGTRHDAILHAAGANARHGLRRTVADKRRSVETLLDNTDWSQWSDRQIAKACNVSPTFVGKIRSERAQIDTVHVDSIDERTYIHPKTGEPTTMRTGNIGGSKPAAERNKRKAARSAQNDPGAAQPASAPIAPESPETPQQTPDFPSSARTVTITITLTAARGLHAYLNQFNTVPAPAMPFTREIFAVLDAHLAPPSSPEQPKRVSTDWQNGWTDADQMEYDRLSAARIWQVSDITRPAVCLRLIENEEADFHPALWSRHERLINKTV